MPRVGSYVGAHRIQIGITDCQAKRVLEMREIQKQSNIVKHVSSRRVGQRIYSFSTRHSLDSVAGRLACIQHIRHRRTRTRATLFSRARLDLEHRRTQGSTATLRIPSRTPFPRDGVVQAPQDMEDTNQWVRRSRHTVDSPLECLRVASRIAPTCLAFSARQISTG
jgi:hypothetical protein